MSHFDNFIPPKYHKYPSCSVGIIVPTGQSAIFLVEAISLLILVENIGLLIRQCPKIDGLINDAFVLILLVD